MVKTFFLEIYTILYKVSLRRELNSLNEEISQMRVDVVHATDEFNAILQEELEIKTK